MLYGALFCAGLSLCAATFYQWHQWLPTELAKHSEKGFLQFHMQRITLAKAFYFIMGIVCIVSALLFFTPLANGLLRGPLFVDGEWHCELLGIKVQFQMFYTHDLHGLHLPLLYSGAVL